MRGTILKGKTGYDQYTAPLTAAVEPPGGGGTPHMKMVGMLVVSLKVVNFGFWSRLGLHAKKYKNIYLICVFLISFIYAIHII